MKKQQQFVATLCFFALLLLQCASEDLPFKAVNLGGWIVTEGWMMPSLFDGIPNKDMLDGTQVHFKSVRLNKYLCAENGGGSTLVANRDIPKRWETFRLWRINESTFNFRVFNKDFVGLSTQGQGIKVFAHAAEPGITETFRIVRNGDNPLLVRIQASNDLFLQAETEDSVMADYSGSLDDWGDEDPSVFEMHIVKTLQGEYQLTNGYGPDKAPGILRGHWSTYIVEDDFRFMSENGLNAVRIPVGWWIMHDPDPPKPFVGGSLQVLDNAFAWALDYNMKVIVDLHAVPGSQNGNHHSGTRDGFLEWGDSRIPDTVSVIDFLAQRYGSHPSLGAIELMNEPLAPGVTLDSLMKYYKAAYDAVRTYTATAYVILSNRLGEANSTELFPLAAGLNHSVIDVHYYNRYSDYFKNMNAQQNIDYIYKQRSKQLQEVTRNGGPLSFVGEWTADLYFHNASKQEYQKFAKAQLDVYGKATFGWAYWSYKCDPKYWSFKWMIENNYIRI
ncbi:Glucan 1,3-beta-glucosidase [Handroanthus impetiginosus]|uniref:Glucan 1,3-beta-glucosidase n=1 Tax=Handroanthus impetiginosus TaxID=429701 RepID=A0A2G9I4Q3_9LAMI|nr:Glucan 1,3-beta-glucosidase [Handroanthus impetiginosus]